MKRSWENLDQASRGPLPGPTPTPAEEVFAERMRINKAQSLLVPAMIALTMGVLLAQVGLALPWAPIFSLPSFLGYALCNRKMPPVGFFFVGLGMALLFSVVALALGANACVHLMFPD